MKANNVIEIELNAEETKVLSDAYKILQEVGDIAHDNNCYFVFGNEFNYFLDMINDKKIILRKL